MGRIRQTLVARYQFKTLGTYYSSLARYLMPMHNYVVSPPPWLKVDINFQV